MWPYIDRLYIISIIMEFRVKGGTPYIILIIYTYKITCSLRKTEHYI